MEEYMISPEAAKKIAQTIAKDIERRLHAGEQQIEYKLINNDPGMNYVMVDVLSSDKNWMIDPEHDYE